jgi:hypothetical protein
MQSVDERESSCGRQIDLALSRKQLGLHCMRRKRRRRLVVLCIPIVYALHVIEKIVAARKALTWTRSIAVLVVAKVRSVPMIFKIVWQYSRVIIFRLSSSTTFIAYSLVLLLTYSY